MVKETHVTLSLPKGMKQTEIGLIPEDWEVIELGDIVDYIKGYPFKSKDYCSNGVRIIRISDTTYNSIKDYGQIYVSDKVANFTKRWSLNQGDLILSTVGSKPPMYDSMVGKVIFVKAKYAGSLLNQNAVLFKNKNTSLQIILANISNTKRYVEFIESIYRGNANQASITLNELFKFKIPIPPLAEQEAIEAALSDCDAWIESLEAVIAKKRLIKQGAMQELLTPKEDWEVKKLGEVGKCLRGVSYSGDTDLYEIETENSIKLLRSNNIFNSKVVLENIQNVNRLKVKSHQVIILQDILICMANGSKDLVGKAGICNKKVADNFYTFGAFMGVFRIFDGYQKYFIYLNFLTKNYRNHIDLLLSGSSINNLKPSDIESIEIRIPSLSEQTRIATVLSDMDAELETLGQKLNKASQIKQGMMQELLTGRVRLV